MSYDPINKDNINYLLNELAKEYKKEYGRHSNVEIVLVGGAAILAKYNFRYASGDIDFTTPAASVIKEVANRVGERLDLPNGWLNNDFVQTESFSHKIYEHSKYYKEFAQVLTVRVVSDEYLVAMKLKAGRGYKNDISDIVGILAENKSEGREITYGKIDQAMNELYGGWDGVSESLASFVKNAVGSDRLEELYNDVTVQEQNNRNIVLDTIGITQDRDIIENVVADIKEQLLLEMSTKVEVAKEDVDNDSTDIERQIDDSTMHEIDFDQYDDEEDVGLDDFEK